MKKKGPSIDATGKVRGLAGSQERAGLGEVVSALQSNMQKIAHLSAMTRTVMQRLVKSPEDLQMIFEALCVIEQITGYKGDGSLDFLVHMVTEH